MEMKQATNEQIDTAIDYFLQEKITFDLDTKTGVRDTARMIAAFLSHRENYSVRYIENSLHEAQTHPH